MQIVVCILCRGFPVEGNLYTLSVITAEVNEHILTRSRGGDVIVNVRRTGIVPLAKDGPCGTIIVGYQHDEPVIGACRLRGGKRTAVGSQGEVKTEGRVGVQRSGRSDKPILTICTVNIHSCVAVKNAVNRAKIPAC